MSKLVIDTQYCENYGDRDNPRWKFKGGETYVLRGLTNEQLSNVDVVVGKFYDMVSYSNEMTEEYVIGWYVAGDDDEVCEEWETPWNFVKVEGRWFIERFVPAEAWWSGDYAGKYERRPADQGSLYNPDDCITEYVEKEVA